MIGNELTILKFDGCIGLVDDLRSIRILIEQSVQPQFLDLGLHRLMSVNVRAAFFRSANGNLSAH